MAKRYATPPMRTLAQLAAIPPGIAVMVGRVMIRSGQIEYNLLLVAKRLAGTGIKQARVIFSSPRWSDYLDKIHDLAELRDFDLQIDLNKCKADLEEAEKRRNLLAHSQWMHDGPKVYVQYTRGAYQPKGLGRKSHRTLYPEGVNLDAAFRIEALKCIEKARKIVRALEKRTTNIPAPSKSRSHKR